uniref:Uncharacterized protein n=1 Tax=Ananas comosus var. bracteatus TaxID=296719 RepID=A0A6V7Q4N2_ANACO|nr:unnamed protein product [Ananas comosus var. bracteatus]
MYIESLVREEEESHSSEGEGKLVMWQQTLGIHGSTQGSPACAAPNGPVVVYTPHGNPLRHPIPHGRATVAEANSGVPACRELPSQACANEHNGKQARSTVQHVSIITISFAMFSVSILDRNFNITNMNNN